MPHLDFAPMCRAPRDRQPFQIIGENPGNAPPGPRIHGKGFHARGHQFQANILPGIVAGGEHHRGAVRVFHMAEIKLTGGNGERVHQNIDAQVGQQLQGGFHKGRGGYPSIPAQHNPPGPQHLQRIAPDGRHQPPYKLGSQP